MRASLMKRRAGGESSGVALGQQLDGDVAVEGGVAGAVDNAHAAVADRLDQLVARRTGGRSARLDDGRRGRRGGACQVFGHGIPFRGSPVARLGLIQTATGQYNRKPTGFLPGTQDCRIAVLLPVSHFCIIGHTSSA